MSPFICGLEVGGIMLVLIWIGILAVQDLLKEIITPVLRGKYRQDGQKAVARWRNSQSLATLMDKR